MNGHNYEGYCMTVTDVSLFIYKKYFKILLLD